MTELWYRYRCSLPGGHAGAGRVRDFSITTPPLPNAVAALNYCLKRINGWKKGQYHKRRGRRQSKRCSLPRPPYTPTIIPIK
jgi:hypothetical protein